MPKPIKTITCSAHVGIYDNCEYVARIYRDKIIVVSPYIKWAGNSGVYAERKESIRDLSTVKKVIAAINDGAEDLAWALLGRSLDDSYLTANYSN